MDIKTWVFLIVMVVTGSLNTIINKNIQSEPIQYYHGFFTSWLMFIGEIVPIFILNIGLMLNKQKRQNHFIETIKTQKNEDKRPVVKNWIVGMGSIFDFLASTCNTFSFVFLPGSVAQIGRGGIILSVAIYSYLFLKKRYTKLQIFGVFLVIVGLVVVFFGQSLVQDKYTKDHPPKDNNENEENKSGGQLFLGIIFLIISWVIQGFQMVYQEKILNKYEVDLYRYVGLEGTYGLFFSSIALFFTGIITCSKSLKFCYYEKFKNYTLDNPSTGITEIYHNGSPLVFYILGYICSITLFNISGLYITSKLSSLYRMIMDNLRAIIIWFFYLVIMRSDDEYFCSYQFIKLLGFLIFIVGTLFYNKIIGGTEEDKIENKKPNKGSKVLSSMKM